MTLLGVAGDPDRLAPGASVTPSSRSAAATTSPASGSSGDSSRSVASTTVTRDAEAGEHLRQLHPDRATAEHDQRGRQLCSAAIASRLVQ